MAVLEGVTTYFCYLTTLFLHKYQIIIAGLWINKRLAGTGFRVSWKRMILHDLSKFTPSELCPYAQHFFGATKGKYPDPEFEKAWKHHYQHNDHHHEYHQSNLEEALMELLADWFAAERAYEGKWPSGRWSWVERRYKHFASEMHPVSVQFLTGLLCIFGFEQSVMIGLTGSDKEKFDWQEAFEIVGKESQAMKGRFLALWKLADKYKSNCN